MSNRRHYQDPPKKPEQEKKQAKKEVPRQKPKYVQKFEAPPPLPQRPAQKKKYVEKVETKPIVAVRATQIQEQVQKVVLFTTPLKFTSDAKTIASTTLSEANLPEEVEPTPPTACFKIFSSPELHEQQYSDSEDESRGPKWQLQSMKEGTTIAYRYLRHHQKKYKLKKHRNEDENPNTPKNTRPA